eukprot:Tbor_TRINITY_DN4284_c0_g1::TRINITY_DN4284_c0_g1_i1::g.23829::m.23829/K01303/APEH; acylaminoacyl-peptidase
MSKETSHMTNNTFYHQMLPIKWIPKEYLMDFIGTEDNDNNNTTLSLAFLAAIWRRMSTTHILRGGSLHPSQHATPQRDIVTCSLMTELLDIDSNSKVMCNQHVTLLKSLSIGDDRLAESKNPYIVINQSHPMRAYSDSMGGTKSQRYLSPCGNVALIFTKTSAISSLTEEYRIDTEKYDSASKCWTSSSVSVLKAPGAPLLDTCIQNISWSPDGKTIAFVGEKAMSKKQKSWELSLSDEASGLCRSDEDVKSRNGKLSSERSPWEPTESWGEGFVNHSQLTIYVVDLSHEHSSMHTCVDIINDSFSTEWSCTCPNLVKKREGKQWSLVFSAYSHNPRRYGLIYCRNRPTTSFVVDYIPGDNNQVPKCLRLLSPFRAVVNIRVHHESHQLAFFSPCSIGSSAVPENHPHNCCFSLHVVNIYDLLDDNSDCEKVSCIVPIIYDPIIEQTKSGDKSSVIEFHGLYPSRGNELYWLTGQYILLDSIARTSNQIFLVNINSKTCRPLRVHASTSMDSAVDRSDLNPYHGCWTIMSAVGTSVLISHSSLLSGIVAYYIDNILCSIDGTEINHEDSSPVSLYKPYEVYGTPIIINVPPINPNEKVCTRVIRCKDSNDSEVLYHSHKDTAASDVHRPTVVLVHGGPHSTDVGAYSNEQYFLILLGFNILSINYGGSLGFGQRRIEQLMGNVGTNDVTDCIRCIQMMIDNKIEGSCVDPTKLIISGGSHGGFIAAHLTGQYPNMFKAAIIRNPVINLASVYFESDIPDWATAVSGASDAVGLGEGMDIERMWKISPIYHASAVRTPTLLGIGKCDLRVPPSQGRAWYHALRDTEHRRLQSGISSEPNALPLVRKIEYEDNAHPLNGVHAAADFAIQAAMLSIISVCVSDESN